MWGRKRWAMGQDVDQPWITYTGLVTDLRARITGRSHIEAWCLRCGETECYTIKMPRTMRGLARMLAERGEAKHPVRVDHLERHRHGGPAPEMSLTEVRRELGKLEAWRAR